MPVTPFHFGPGVMLKAALPRRVSLTAFVAANVVIDAESVVNLLAGRWPVHAALHTLVGALAVGLAAGFAVAAVGRWRRWRGAEWALPAALTGGVLGGLGQTLLDAVMHADLRPFLPLTDANPLLRIVALDVLHSACLLAGFVGVAGIGWRWWRALPR